MSEHTHDNNSSTFLLGIAIGAALTYLFVSKSGQKIKTELLKDVVKALEGLGEELEEVEEKAEKQILEKKEEVEEKVTDLKQEAQDRFSDATHKVKEDIREVPEHIEKIQKKGRHFFFKKPDTDS